MKKIAFFSLSVAMVLAGCTEKPTPDPNPGPGPDTQDVTFTVTASGTTENGATVAVSHDGTDANTYYGFYTSDLATGVNAAINQKINELTSGSEDLSTVLLKGKTRVVSLTGLTSSTTYRYVVFGLNEDGSTYGTPSSCEFTTTETVETEFTVNSNWTVTYGGKTNDDEYGLSEVISVRSTDSERYFISVFSTTVVSTLGLEACFEASRDNYQEMLDYYGASWTQITHTSSAEELFDVFDSGEYYAFAIGVTTSGELTGKYAQSAAFTPEELEASDAYKKWLGTWNVTDAAGATHTFTFSTSTPEVNYSLSFADGLPSIKVNFSSSDGSAVMVSNAGLGTATSQYGDYELGYYPTVYSESDGKTYYITSDGAQFCKLALSNDSNATGTALDINVTGLGECPTKTSTYAGIITSAGDYYGAVLTFRDVTAVTFPITLTKAASSASVSAKNLGLVKVMSIDATTARLMTATAR